MTPPMPPLLSLIHAGRELDHYRAIKRAMPLMARKVDRIVDYVEACRRGLRTAAVYRFDRPASRFAGSYSVDILAENAARLPSLVAAARSRVPEAGIFIEYQLDAMLEGVGAHDSARLFAPADPRDQRNAGFLFRPCRGHIEAVMWVQEEIDRRVFAALEPFAVSIGAGGNVDLPPDAEGHWPDPTALALASTRSVPHAVGIIGMCRTPVSGGMADIVSRGGGLSFLSDRAGVARRALALLTLVLDPPTRLGVASPYPETHRAPGTASRARHSVSAVTLRLVGTATPPAGRSGGSTGPRAEHEVRGHWRNIRPRCFCAPGLADWMPPEPGQQTCVRCNGRRTFVPDHKRGDAALATISRAYINVRV